MRPVDYSITDIPTAEWVAVVVIVAVAAVLLLRGLLRPRKCKTSCDGCALSHNCRKKEKK